jgi:hypothetical protein
MFSDFGNKVKIKSTPETFKKGVANKVGEVFGQTTPSNMEVEVIGTPKEDFAVNVYFEDTNESFWFDKELLEHMDNGEGSVITVDGIDKKWIKTANGNWIEKIISQEEDIVRLKKWWQFWK